MAIPTTERNDTWNCSADHVPRTVLLQVMELEKSFTRFREANSPRRSAEASPQAEQEEHRVFATDLVAALSVSEEEAEEMIFIADLQETSSIDFTEFRNLVVNWG